MLTYLGRRGLSGSPSVEFSNITHPGSPGNLLVGDRYRATVTGGPPNSPVAITFVQGGVTMFTRMPVGNTDSSGSVSFDGVANADMLGRCALQYSIGGVLVPPSIAFTVSSSQAEVDAAQAAAVKAQADQDAAAAKAQADQAQAIKDAAAKAAADAVAKYQADQTEANRMAAAQAQATKDAADQAAANTAADADIIKAQSDATPCAMKFLPGLKICDSYVLLGGLAIGGLFFMMAMKGR